MASTALPAQQALVIPVVEAAPRSSRISTHKDAVVVEEDTEVVRGMDDGIVAAAVEEDMAVETIEVAEVTTEAEVAAVGGSCYAMCNVCLVVKVF